MSENTNVLTRAEMMVRLTEIEMYVVLVGDKYSKGGYNHRLTDDPKKAKIYHRLGHAKAHVQGWIKEDPTKPVTIVSFGLTLPRVVDIGDYIKKTKAEIEERRRLRY